MRDPLIVVHLEKAPLRGTGGGPEFVRWTGTGAGPKSAAARTITRPIQGYSWLDRKRSVKIWLKVPGVRGVPPGDVAVAFRAKSFDVSVTERRPAGEVLVQTFAVTELPMEILPSESSVRVSDSEDVLEVLLRKEVQTTWFKLQVHH